LEASGHAAVQHDLYAVQQAVCQALMLHCTKISFRIGINTWKPER